MSEPLLAVATGNSHKASEIYQILKPLIPRLRRDQIVTQKDLGVPSPVEDGVTFKENALLKARAVAEASGLPTVADDSGLVVDVMGQAPGIFSARWAGAHGDDQQNVRLLLSQLQDVPDDNRGARFVCSAVLVLPDGSHHGAQGTVQGKIIRAPRGDHGFGYDPVFRPEGWEKTTAEVPAEEKNSVSHRAEAFTALAPLIQKLVVEA